MPLFELDAERPVLVQHARPGGTSGTDAQRVVDGHLDGLLGERIFPVRQGTSDDEPHLLALDGAGLPVVIEVVAELTEERLVRSLNHAGRAGRLSRADLAAQYAGGASGFQQDMAAFNDNVPLTRSHAAARAAGARLIVICSSAAPDVLDALDFLRQPGSPVTVLGISVLHGADGRRFVDVSPLVVAPTPARATPAATPAPTTPVAPTRAAPAPGASPSVAPLSRAERRRALEAATTMYGTVPTSDVETGALTIRAPVPPPPPPTVDAPAADAPAVYTPATPAPPAADTPPTDEPSLGPDDDPDLCALARTIGTPTALVWSRPRRGQRFEAVLHPDGFIELSGGGRYRHPDAAAVAASGRETADGWSLWRLGDQGPTLTDAFRAASVKA